MEDQNNRPKKAKWLYVYFLFFSLLFFIVAALIYTRAIGFLEKDLAWLFAGFGILDFLMAYIFRSRNNG